MGGGFLNFLSIFCPQKTSPFPVELPSPLPFVRIIREYMRRAANALPRVCGNEHSTKKDGIRAENAVETRRMHRKTNEKEFLSPFVD